ANAAEDDDAHVDSSHRDARADGNDPSNPPPFVIPADLKHPYLFVGQNERVQLLQQWSRSTRLSAGWQYLQNSAVSMLNAVPPNEPFARKGPSPHASYGIAADGYARHLTNLSFVAFMTNDSKMTAKAIEWLLAACAYERWLGPGLDDKTHSNPPLQSSLETATITVAVATSYDLLYPRLTDEQRQTVRQALLKKGVEPLFKEWVQPRLLSQILSQTSEQRTPCDDWSTLYCAASAGVGAMAIQGEEPQATEILKMTYRSLCGYLRVLGSGWYLERTAVIDRPPHMGESASFDGRGDWDAPERIARMGEAMASVCCFADAAHRMTGINLFDDEHLRAFSRKELFQRMIGEEPKRWMGPTGVPWRPTWFDVAAWNALAWEQNGQLQRSVRPFDLQDPSATFPLLCAAMTRFKRDTTAAWLAERISPIPKNLHELLWLDESVMASPPICTTPMAVFHDEGYVVMRSGWGPNSPMATIQLCPGGNPFWSLKNHRAVGRLMLFGGGHPTLFDARPMCNRASRDDQNLNDIIKSPTRTFPSNDQAKASENDWMAAVSTSQLMVASGQLAAAHPDVLKSWTRDVVMLPDGLAIVLDRLEGKEPQRFDYVLQPYEPFQIPRIEAAPGELRVGQGIVQSDKADDGTGSTARATRLDLYSEAPFVATRMSDGADGADSSNDSHGSKSSSSVRFDSREPTLTRTYLLVCQWPKPGVFKQPTVDVASNGEGRWQIRRITDDWRLVLRTGTDANASNASNARLVAFWDQGDKSRHRHGLVLGGQRLSVENHELMRSSQPINAAIEYGRPVWAQFWANEPTQVTLLLDEGLNYVFLDGNRLDATRQQDNTVTFDIPAGPSVVQVSEMPRFIERTPSIVVDDLLRAPYHGGGIMGTR
ncbi:MAG: hypothetical protein FWC56_00620, partial [Phycisphaerae bacterium]|nr:hypothetical protein [Phycisphaerae bacterium]